MDAKSCWKSKTIWLNGIVLATAVAGFLTTHEIVREHPVVVAVLVVLQAVGNLVLRFVSSTPVKLK
jgi:hypothetical protein